MNSSINRRELFNKAIAGLFGGALGWLPVEIASHGHSLTEQISSFDAALSYVSMAILSGVVGGFILAVSGPRIEWNTSTRNNLVRGFLVCMLLALPADYASNYVFSAMLSFGGWGLGHPGSGFFLFMGRVMSWLIMGASLGAGVGIASMSMPNIAKGALGGFIGGFAGGILFDPINQATGGGLWSRLIGLSLIGFFIGLFIGLVQELTKMAWVTVEQGRLRGRQFRVEGARATLGRAEENPIGLFGDPGVQQRHAVIERHGSDFVLKSLAIQDGTFVNGNRVESADLHDGDRIGVGGYELAFHLRQGSASARGPMGQQARQAGAGTITAAVHVESRIAPAQASATGPALEDASGTRHTLRADAATTMGRALDNDIVINHSSVSRHHASVIASDAGFELKDLNSQNGTFVADRRITQARLADGDSIRIGQAPFTFRA
ncbi:MAG TPA: FHA domain-containing protein [Candidatus Binataceae bacterium]|nr:FHA domain-containing protein [Candidatus Binataceae bacterium]